MGHPHLIGCRSLTLSLVHAEAATCHQQAAGPACCSRAADPGRPARSAAGAQPRGPSLPHFPGRQHRSTMPSPCQPTAHCSMLVAAEGSIATRRVVLMLCSHAQHGALHNRAHGAANCCMRRCAHSREVVGSRRCQPARGRSTSQQRGAQWPPSRPKLRWMVMDGSKGGLRAYIEPPGRYGTAPGTRVDHG